MSQATSHVESEPAADSGRQAIDVRAVFDRIRAASRRDPYPSYETRMQRLKALHDAVVDKQDEIAEAVRKDFGNRSVHETKVAEIFMTASLINYIRKNLKKWMRPESRHVSMTFKPGRAKVHYQPVGVVGIIAPWNYPFQLAVGPLAYALAAGNRALLKPSEYTPEVSDLLRRVCSAIFDPDVVSVVTGGPEVGEAFTHLPFDHLLFTGSTHVGRLVMKAAAENLTPVTLELGGKSPTIVSDDYPIDKAVARIAAGKWFNSGQTCIAPDYLLVPKAKVDRFVERLRAQTSEYYPSLKDNPDYTSIVSDRHYKRLKGLVEDAVQKKARSIEVNPKGEELPPESRKLSPTILTDVNDDMAVMQEEIFGPVLPILPYDTLDEAIEYVNERPRPLALYVFDYDKDRAGRVLEQTVSGGACVNETVFHFGVDDMPFGGIGPSGIGAYHGKEGFDTFSHKKGVFYQAKLNAANMLAPPYGERIDKMLKMLIK